MTDQDSIEPATAALAPGDIDALIVASESDFFTLQLNPAAVLAQDLGLTGVMYQARPEGPSAPKALLSYGPPHNFK